MKKTTRNILISFVLNSVFAVLEIIGGVFTNSFAIISDGLHDIGDAFALGAAYILEKKSEKKPNDNYTYGYQRYSVIAALLTSLILVVGSVVIIYSAVLRVLNPEPVRGFWMMIFAGVGLLVNGLAYFVTREKENLNERAINLHMLEDVLGWVVVLLGAVAIYLWNWYIIDPILSILVALFIFYQALRNVLQVLGVLSEKAPKGFQMGEYQTQIRALAGVHDIHHVHVWTLDGTNLLATLHIVLENECSLNEALATKSLINQVSASFKIAHVTVQFDAEGAECDDCHLADAPCSDEHHHHHHH